MPRIECSPVETLLVDTLLRCEAMVEEKAADLQRKAREAADPEWSKSISSAASELLKAEQWRKVKALALIASAYGAEIPAAHPLLAGGTNEENDAGSVWRETDENLLVIGWGSDMLERKLTPDAPLKKKADARAEWEAERLPPDLSS